MTSRVVENPAAPGSDAWRKMLTPSKIPSVLAVSRFKSQFATWHEMAGLVEPAPIDADRQDLFDYGHAAEAAASVYWKRKNPGWRLSAGEVQFTRDDLPYPNAATIDGRASRGRKRRVVEKKTARSLEEWGDDGSGVIPEDYAAQVIFQMFITGWHDPADLVLWPQYGRPRIYTVEYNEALAAFIDAKARAWHQSLITGERPDLDDTVTTYECIRQMHPEIDGREVEVDPDLAIRYLEHVAEDKGVTKRLRGVKSELLDVMGQGETAMCMGQKIATRTPWRGDTVALKANTKTDPATIGELIA